MIKKTSRNEKQIKTRIQEQLELIDDTVDLIAQNELANQIFYNIVDVIEIHLKQDDGPKPKVMAAEMLAIARYYKKALNSWPDSIDISQEAE